MAETKVSGVKDPQKNPTSLLLPQKTAFATPKPTASSKAKQVQPPVPVSASTRLSNPTARGNFSKGLEELDKIQRKLHSGSNLRGRKTADLGDSELQNTIDESGCGANDEPKRDRLSARRATMGVQASALKKTSNSSGNKEQGTALPTQPAGKKLNVLKCNRMVDEVALVFSQGFKRIEEFEKEAGVQIRIADFTKEYQKVIESMRELTKNPSKLK